MLCRAEAAYLDALQRAGGLEDATPKRLLQLLVPQFPGMTLLVRAV